MFLRLCNDIGGGGRESHTLTWPHPPPDTLQLKAMSHWSFPSFSSSICLLTLSSPTFWSCHPSPYICKPSPSLHPEHQPLPSPWPHLHKHIFGSLSPSILPLQFSLTNLLLSQGFLNFPCFFNHHSNDLRNTHMHTALSMGLAARPHPSQKHRRWNAPNKT